MTKRILAMILCLALCVSMIPAATAADVDDVEIVGEEALLPPEEAAEDIEIDLPAEEGAEEAAPAVEILDLPAEEPAEELEKPAAEEAAPAAEIDLPAEEPAEEAAPGLPSDEIALIDTPAEDGIALIDEPDAAQLPGADEIQAAVASGTCGDAIKWRLNDDGELYIYGSGDMYDYERYAAPWYQYRNQITGLTLSSGITRLGNYAFSDCAKLNLSGHQGGKALPSSLTSIGECAFFSDSALTYVFIPANVTEIGRQAFDYSGLKRLTVAGAPSLANRAFGCASLTEISFLGNAPTFTNNYTFRNTVATAWYPSDNSTWTSDVLKDYAGTITWQAGYHGWCGDNVAWDFNTSSNLLVLSGSGATWNYTHSYYSYSSDDSFVRTALPPSFRVLRDRITSVTVSTGITELGTFTFAQMTKIASVSLPETLTTIGVEVFENCTALTAINIPKSVTSVGIMAFYNCSGLTEVHFLGHAPEIGSNAFSGVSAKAYYYRLYSWTSENKLQYGATKLTWMYDSYVGDKVYWELDADGTLCIASNGSGGGTWDFPSDYPSFYDFRDECTTLAVYADVTTLGTYLFYKMDSLTSARIGYGVTEIKANCFYGCTSLENITFMGDAPSFASNCFSGVSATAYYPPLSDGSWTSSVLQNYGGGITWVCDNQVGDDATWELNLSSGVVRVIGTGATWDYTDLGGDNPSPIPRRNALIKGIVVGEGITSIGEYLFRSCQYATSVSLPSTLESIGQLAFFDCEALVSVTIPKSVTFIGWQAFAGCGKLAEVTIQGTPSFHQACFAKNPSLSKVYFKSHAPWTIPSNTFVYDTVTVYYYPVYSWTEDKLTQPEIGSVTWVCDDKVGDNVTWELGETGYLFLNGEGATWDFDTDEPGFYWFRDEVEAAGVDENVTRLGDYLFWEMDHLKEVDFPYGSVYQYLTEIGEYAFYDCKALTYIQIPAGVTTIGSLAFAGCTLLSEVYFRGLAPSIDWNAFKGVTATAYYPPVTDGGWTSSVMQNYEGALTWVLDNKAGDDVTWEVTLATGTLTLSGTGSTWDWTWDKTSYVGFNKYVTTAVVGEGITRLGYCTFGFMYDLASVSLPESLTEIYQFAFHACYDLKSLTIPGFVTTIAQKAFYGLYLEEVHFLGHPPTIAEDAFQGVTAKVYYPPVYTWTSDLMQHYGGTLTWTKEDKIGDNANWSLEKYYSGLISANIYGYGDTWDYTGRSPLYWFHDDIDLMTISRVYGSVWDWEEGENRGITSIGDGLLSGLDKLTSLTLPLTLQKIGDHAFDGCTALKDLYFGGYAPSFDADCFAGLTATAHYPPIANGGWTSSVLKNYGGTITWDLHNKIGNGAQNAPGSNATWALDENGVLNITGTGALMECKWGESYFANYIFYYDGSCKKIAIGEGITSVGRELFSSMPFVEEISLPGTLTTIGRWAFVWCTGVTELELPDSLTTIQEGAFEAMRKLESIRIPEGVTVLPEYLFWSNYAMTSVSLPNSLKEIKEAAFCDCTGLTSIDIPRGVTKIGANVFEDCSALTEIHFLGHAPTTIAEDAFKTVTATAYYFPVYSWTEAKMQQYGADNLTWVKDEKVGDDIVWKLDENSLLTITGTGEFWDPFFTKIPGYMYFYDEITRAVIGEGVTMLDWFQFSGMEAMTEVLLPSTLESIGAWAFSGCTSLKTIDIPGLVAEIGALAFEDCSSLETIYFRGSAPSFGGSCFKGVTATAWYTANDPTWTEDVRQDYGGHITWEPYLGYAVTVGNFTKGVAACSLSPGAEYLGETTFTVSSTDDKAVVVAIRNGESYTRVPCTTDASGVHYFTIDVNAPVEIAIALKGDVNLDGAIKGTDGTMLKRAILGSYTLKNELAFLAADLNGDGILKGSEGTQIARSILGTFTIKW